MRGAITEFPGYAQYATTELLTAYAEGPARMRHVLGGLSEEELRARPRGPDAWSAHDIAIHSCDSEIQGVYRMRKVLSEAGPPLPGYDQDAWATRYLHEDAGGRNRALDLLEHLRRATLPLLQRATPEDWSRWGTHPEYGRVTLRNLLELYADHTERHISQILAIRRLLGRGLDFPLLLPERLY